ncbi:MAG: anti sigma factor C-terminal domain-containing protein [Erysipelotrichaceae bacterium]|nr:anti sigma factor C-terminal domain-containing protein [Erysipelotrichaceae bacterium]
MSFRTPFYKDGKEYEIIIVIIVVLVIAGAHIYTTTTNYNPNNEEKIFDSDENLEYGYLLTTILEMQYPGLSIVIDDECTAKGFGRYEANAYVDFYYKQGDTATPTVKFTINESDVFSTDFIELDETYEDIFTGTTNEFMLPGELYNINYIEKDKDLYNEVKNIEYLDASLSFGKEKTLDEIVEMMVKYDQLDFIWLALDHVDNYDWPIGLSLIDGKYADIELTDTVDSHYPNLILSKNVITADTIKQSYISNLQLLKDHSDFMDMILSSAFGAYIVDETLNDLSNRTLKDVTCYGIRVIGSGEDIIEMVDNEQITNLCINNE